MLVRLNIEVDNLDEEIKNIVRTMVSAPLKPGDMLDIYYATNINIDVEFLKRACILNRYGHIRFDQEELDQDIKSLERALSFLKALKDDSYADESSSESTQD